MIWDKPVVLGWCGILVILFVYEFWALLDKNPHTPPLTNLVVRYVPWWATMSLLTWLLIHFAIRYASPVYLQRLKLLGTAVSPIRSWFS